MLSLYRDELSPLGGGDDERPWAIVGDIAKCAQIECETIYQGPIVVRSVSVPVLS